MNDAPWVLGVSASHNGAACLLRGDEIVAAVQEERLTRKKRERIYAGEPSLAVQYCLDAAGIDSADLELVVFCVQGYRTNSRHDAARNAQLRIDEGAVSWRYMPHHLGHAYSAFAASGFADAAILVVDGLGSPLSEVRDDEREALVEAAVDGVENTSIYDASGTRMICREKHAAPRGAWLDSIDGPYPRFHGLGGMYSAAAISMFGNAMDAGKVMGLAPYGASLFPPSAFFSYAEPAFRFHDEVPARFPERSLWPLDFERHEAVAASVQGALEEAMMILVQRARLHSSSANLCLAGGVALNSVANERIVRSRLFENVFIIPAAEDSGCAIGAAYYGLWQLTGRNGQRRLVSDGLGRGYSRTEIELAGVATDGIHARSIADAPREAARLIANGKIVGWFSGGSELGPRALGHRSILCDPRRDDAKDVLNARVKHREPFRPFAPSILAERASEWFELDGESPFMLRVCNVRAERRHLVPAITHVDGTTRPQTVTLEANAPYYRLISEFAAATGVPVVLNTSFNVMGEPIVETPADAVRCLVSTGLDALVFEDRVLEKRYDGVSVGGVHA